MEGSHYQKEWHSCPECGASVTMLNVWPSKYAGVWECIDCDVSGFCEHENSRRISSADELGEYEIIECADCEVALEEATA